MLPIFGSIYSFLLDIQHTHIQTGKRRTMWKMLRVYTDKTNRPLNSSGLSLFKSFLLYVSFSLLFPLFLLLLPAAFLGRGSWPVVWERQLQLTIWGKTALARPITRRQNTLHVIVLGIHAWLTEWVLMRLGNRKKHSSISLMDWFIRARPHIHKPGTHTHLLVIPTEQRWTISLACTWRSTYSRDKTTKQLKCACECV